jgi:hypothetical protein
MHGAHISHSSAQPNPMARKGVTGPADHRLLAGLARRSRLRRVRDEEAAGSNPATPTGKQQVTGTLRSAVCYLPSSMSDFGSHLGVGRPLGQGITASSECVGLMGFAFLSRLTQIASLLPDSCSRCRVYASGFLPAPPRSDAFASGSELAPPLPPGTFTPDRSPMPGVLKAVPLRGTASRRLPVPSQRGGAADLACSFGGAQLVRRACCWLR